MTDTRPPTDGSAPRRTRVRWRAAAAVLAAALAVPAALALPGALPAAAQGASASLVAPATNVAPGGAVTVTLRAAGVADLAGYQAGIEWDAALLEFDAVTPLDWVTSSGRRMEALEPVATAHSLDFLVYTLPPTPGQPAPGVSGEGDLAAIRFVARAVGRAEITLRELLLTTTANEPIAVARSGATVVIAPNTLPTPVPTPTHTPGAAPRLHIHLPYAVNRR